MLDWVPEAERVEKSSGQQQSQLSWPDLIGPSMKEAEILAAYWMAGSSPAMTTEEAAGRPVTLGHAIQRLSRLFRKAGIVTAQLDVRLLAAEAYGLSREESIVRSGLPLRPGEAQRLAGFAARRLAGEPVSRILGRREFWGLSFHISPAVLDPRPETELLAETVRDHIEAQGRLIAPLRILDLGTGSGCLLGALLSELPRSHGIGIDRSEAALTVARDNLSRLGLRDRAAFLCGDWMSAIGGTAFDIIVSNPPYVAQSEICQLETDVRAYDPLLALDGGEDGLDAYRTLLPQARAALRPGGILVCETGYRQGRAVLDILKRSASNHGLFEAKLLTDLAGAERAVAGYMHVVPAKAGTQ
jgi:release factor glutamine methyltransferase